MSCPQPVQHRPWCLENHGGIRFQKEVEALSLSETMRGPYTNLRPLLPGGGGPGGLTARPTGFTLTAALPTAWITGATAMRAGVTLTPSGLHKRTARITHLLGASRGEPDKHPASSRDRCRSESCCQESRRSQGDWCCVGGNSCCQTAAAAMGNPTAANTCFNSTTEGRSQASNHDIPPISSALGT